MRVIDNKGNMEPEPIKKDSETEIDPTPAPLESHEAAGEENPYQRGLFRTPWRTYLQWSALALTLFLVALGSAAFLSLRSAPGEGLYPLKTGTIEGAVLRTKAGDDARISYDITLLKRRLEEMQVLARDNEVVTEETLATLAKLIDAHTKDAIATLGSASALGNETRVDRASELVYLTNTEDALVANTEEFASIQDAVQETQHSASTYLETAIETLVSTGSQESVYAYLSAQVQSVSTELTTVAHGSTAERLAQSRLSDMKDAIVDGKLADALTYVLKAREAIAADQYLYDAERGPIDGVPIEATSIPEGN